MMFLKRGFCVLLIVCAALWVGNTTLFVGIPAEQQPELLAHRGVHQIYAGTDRDNDTCSTNPVAPNTHGLIANTLPSIAAAFEAGAEVVEIDVHLTTDNVFAVFHDWALDCQTDGTGVTHEQTFDYLRGLDLGYGYISDGVTFPLRGNAPQMPRLTEVFAAFPKGRFLINFKSNRAEEGPPMATLLANHRDQTFGVYGGARPTRAAIAELEGLRGYDKQRLKSCLIRYAISGWTGRVPLVCRDMIIAVPMDYGPYLWGWPHRFTTRMKEAGTTVILLGDYDGSGFSSGIDDAATLARVPPQFDGYLWTNRIEIIGPQFP